MLRCKNIFKNISVCRRMVMGSSNSIFYVVNDDKKYIVRFFGDVSIDRTTENKIMQFMSYLGYAPKIIKFIDDGRVEQFVESRTLSRHSVMDDGNINDIIKIISKLHYFEPNVGKKCEIINHINKYLSRIAKHNYDMCDHIQNINNYLTKIQYIDDIVLCHNDINCGNILQGKNDNKLWLIDYEYSFNNYRAFDLANLLIETYIDNNAETENGYVIYDNCDFDPNILRKLIVKYCSRNNMVGEYNRLYSEVVHIIPLTHLFWGLWSIDRYLKNLKYGDNATKFNYLKYGSERLELFEYCVKKKGCVKIEFI